jgi:deoxyribonuclease-4
MRLGAHMSIAGGIYQALERGNEVNCESIQLFTKSNRQWAAKPLIDEDIQSFKAARNTFKDIRPVFSHTSYLINLGTHNPEVLQKSIDSMAIEIERAESLGLEYIVLHPGSATGIDEGETEEDAMNRIADNLNNVFAKTRGYKSIVCLETMAGQGNNVGYKFEQLKFIIDQIKDKKRIGVCFDTCHAFGAGYDFTTQAKYEKMWGEFDNIIGLNYLYCFHLNDSENELNSRVDRHIHIGEGVIGKGPFAFFLNDERFKDHPGVLETPKTGTDLKNDERNLKVLRSLIKKK